VVRLTEPQVSRRIPVLNLPVKDVHKDVNVPHVYEAETGTHDTSVDVRTFPDSSKQSAFNSGSLAVVENVCKNANMTRTGERLADDHKDIAKKPRLQKPAVDSLLSSPVEAGHLRNIAKLGVECLGDKTAKVTYVGSGLISLPSSMLSDASRAVSSGESATQVLSYTLYTGTPFIDGGQSQSGSWSSSMLSLPHSASHLPTAGSDVLQTLSAADADACTVDSSVIDTEVVETVAAQSSLSHTHKHCRTSPQKPKHATSQGQYLLKY